MTRDLPPEDTRDDLPEDPRRDPRDRLRPTSPAALTLCAVAGLVGGWLLRPLSVAWFDHAPVVTWVQPLVLALAAAILGYTAWSTWRTVHVQRLPLEPQQAVNRLVLGRACALVGALVAGGYLGYAVSQLGLEAELSGQRLVRSVAAGAAGMVICVAGLLLERACRVRKDDPEA